MAPKKKGESKGKLLLDLFKRHKSDNASVTQPNSTRASISSASGPHDPRNDAECTERTALDGNGTLHQDPSASLQLPIHPSSSAPNLTPSVAGQEGDVSDASDTPTPMAQPASINPQTQASDWKATAKEGLGVASRFAQTLLKRVPECIDNNPVKVAFAVAKVIIDITDSVEGNKDELTRSLEVTANRLLAMEKTVEDGLPKAAEQAMKEFKRILGEEMKKLKDLAEKSLAARIFDHEKSKSTIQQIFQRVNEATISFQVQMAISIQNTASQISDDVKKAALERLRPSAKADHKTVLEDQALKREQCTVGTRVRILDDITKWAKDSSLESPRVFWLTGQAGSGKTTIAYTIAKLFEKDGNADQHTVLGANFLCSRQFEETRERTRIIPTLAYQLGRKCKSYADALHVADKFDTVNYDVSTQLKDLLFGPWQQYEATRDPKLSPYLIVIDALDEIKGEGGSAFLRDLFAAINEYNLRGIKFFVTSRSDPEIVTLFESFTSSASHWLQHMPIEEAELDIETYLKFKLPKLSSNPDMAKLVQRASGLFIYAATVVKYLTPHRSISSRDQAEMLTDLLSNSSEPASATDSTFLIDELYRQIMHNTFSKFKGKFLTRRLNILYTFLCAAERTSTSTVAALIAEGDDETAKAVAEDLHAVLYTQDDCVFWYHASFPDFIFDQTRSNFHVSGNTFKFWCNEPAHHNLLGESCFRLMQMEPSGLRFNMGDITSSFLFDRDDAVALAERVEKNINAALSYSSRHWAYHLPSPELIDPASLCRCLADFLQIHVLFWIEAMNLLKLPNQCTLMLQRARQWVLKCGSGQLELARDVGEAANFATHFTGSPAAESTPHLYISALATWRKDTSLSRSWKHQFTRIPVYTHNRGNIGIPLMSISTGSMIRSVACSRDGTRIVSGSSDRSVRVWDASTGVELEELKGHTGSVKSVAFSSDGTRIVSGSDDGSVRVWDASTGVELKELKGHTGWVHSVAISSDGTRIVSGSSDESVRVWDVSTGVELKELKGHTGYVYSVAFLSDGTQIVSGSSDGSVRVWDASTGVELKELKGHTGYVYSVAFLSDGTQIVSGSSDGSVRVWDVSTGVELKELKGHTGYVYSVAFMSDGTQIVSGSSDGSVRVWDASTGVELKELKGHTDSVRSVAFSSDSTQIVSGSDDGSVRVWDASTGVELEELKGHTSWVHSVAFSSDSTQIVSGSSDGSVRVWDASTGVELKELKGHTGFVNSVAFLSDSTQTVSRLHDHSTQIYGFPLSVWNLDASNWIISVSGNHHLMWVSPAADISAPSNPLLVISRNGFGLLDFQQSMIGVHWARCYTPV